MDNDELYRLLKSDDKEDNEKGLNFIYNNWREDILRDIYRLSSDLYAEDVFNCGVERLMAKIKRDDPIKKLKGYLRKTCINLALDMKRSNKIEMLENCLKGVNKKKERLSLDKKIIKPLIKEIGLNCTIILWLFFNNYEHKKIAFVTGYAEDTSKTKKYKCLKKLLNKLRDSSDLRDLLRGSM